MRMPRRCVAVLERCHRAGAGNGQNAGGIERPGEVVAARAGGNGRNLIIRLRVLQRVVVRADADLRPLCGCAGIVDLVETVHIGERMVGNGGYA